MKLILREVQDEQVIGEREFTQDVVRVGRDPTRCDVFFDALRWPMVSRIHAEFRWQNSRLILYDAGSSNGTYVDDQRIAEPVELQPGARVRLGNPGPMLVVVTEQPTAESDDNPTNQANQAPAEGLETPRDAVLLPHPPSVWRSQTTTPVAAARETTPAPSAPLQESIPRPAPIPPESTPTPASHLEESIPAPISSPHESPATAAPTPSTTEFAQLVFEGGTTSGLERHTVLRSDKTLVGRDADASLVINAAAAFVSRRHLEIIRQSDGNYTLVDLKSFNGTLLNGQRIAQPMPLFHGDQIQLGAGGPVLRFVYPAQVVPPRREVAESPTEESGRQEAVRAMSVKRVVKPLPIPDLPADIIDGQRTIFIRRSTRETPQPSPSIDDTQTQLLMERAFGDSKLLTVGRAAGNDLRVDGLQVSNRHARFMRMGEEILVEDIGSTNGVYVNGMRITGRHPLQPQDVVQIGPFVLRADIARGVAVHDTRSKTRIEAVDITQDLPSVTGRGMTRVLDDVDLSIQPNEFVGLLGPSGAGKSMLMNALNGALLPTGGRVLINDLDLYKHLDSLKQSIGYVPQDDIIHRELSVYRTLYYVARLRLSGDVGEDEINQIISEVLDVTGLSERRDLPVARLSGGQRKRVSIAVELITKPSVIFLDEPTSGLDPATEDKIMTLFRQIAESGRTVVLTTHATGNIRLFDKVALLMRGRLVFFGAPPDALEFVGADNFKELYDKLEAPAQAELLKLSPPPPYAKTNEKRTYQARRNAILEEVAQNWRTQFRDTEVYRRNVVEPLSGIQRGMKAASVVGRRLTPIDMVRQWATLVRRYAEVLAHDRTNLLILFGQAPVIALLTYLVVNQSDPRDFPYFVLALVSVWFGTSVAACEIVKERAIYRRERMFNLSLLPYVGSKFFVLALIVGTQCVLLFWGLKLFDLAELMSLPGRYGGALQLLVMILTATVGVALGLFVSAVVKTSEVATSLVPLILIPQILFSGLVGLPNQVTKVFGAMMPATWAFDEMKRLSTLDTLQEEGSDPQGSNRGRGLYEQVKAMNDENVAKARLQIEDYRRRAEESVKDYELKMREHLAAVQSGAPAPAPPAPPTLASPPLVPDAQKIDDDLSGYVSFMHPWGNLVVNPLLLGLMLLVLLTATVVALRAQDTRAR
jgi:ABC-type multidrug transport system ATPase subunit/pSer/pThr/pTyr-binding forkhead associated (FHA) protein